MLVQIHNTCGQLVGWAWLTTNEKIFTQRKIDPSMIENSSVAILQIIEARDEIRKNWWVQFQTTRSSLTFNQTAKVHQLCHATRGRKVEVCLLFLLRPTTKPCYCDVTMHATYFLSRGRGKTLRREC